MDGFQTDDDDDDEDDDSDREMGDDAEGDEADTSRLQKLAAQVLKLYKVHYLVSAIDPGITSIGRSLLSH